MTGDDIHSKELCVSARSQRGSIAPSRLSLLGLGAARCGQTLESPALRSALTSAFRDGLGLLGPAVGERAGRRASHQPRMLLPGSAPEWFTYNAVCCIECSVVDRLHRRGTRNRRILPASSSACSAEEMPENYIAPKSAVVLGVVLMPRCDAHRGWMLRGASARYKTRERNAIGRIWVE